eukprot:Phypoly_transcript_12047.p1 GENE.Phypoly_transcript_12047~~Phypoly_transcript_12047.p1  ORF type:complete len:371 (-),score=78.85 Phypoly_transcript_12047:54-1118(-)
MKAALLVLLCVWACVCLADPTRPTISDQFYAEVHVAVNDNDRPLAGGGVLAIDVPNNKGRTDFKLENSHHEIETIHVLDRYDLHEIYEIFDDQACKTVPVTGNIEDPFAWIAKAEYNGSTTYHNRQHDVWVLNMNDNGNMFERRLYVDSADVNTPVFFTIHNVSNNKVVYDMAISFLSFNPKEPQSWVFNVPTTCNGSLGNYGGCNSGAVVYWANANWNCGDVACSYRVPDGSAQPSYACAEFTARALAAGGYVGLSPTAPQGSYGNYRGYNLLVVSSLSGYCGAAGFSGRAASPSSVQAAYAVMGNGGEGAWSHACIGVGPGIDDCHNIARENHAASGSFFDGVQAVWAPPGC